MKVPSLCPILFISAHIGKKICRYMQRNSSMIAHWRLAVLIHGTWIIVKLQTRFALLLICNHVIGVITWNRHVGLTAAGQSSHEIGHNVHVYLECATSKCTCWVFDIFAARVGSIYFEPDQVNKSLCCNQYCLGLYILGLIIPLKYPLK